jgi:hypothetical protein
MGAIRSSTTESHKLMAPVRLLYLHLLSFPTATSSLAAWISAQGLASDIIRAKVISESYDNAGTTRKGTIATRHVQLVYGPRVLSEATIVYRAYVLPDDLRKTLQSTDLPFGTVIESLGPYRRTTFARTIPARKALIRDDPADAFTPILEIHATVLTARHGPVARVREIYAAGLILNTTSAREHEHATPRMEKVAKT